MLDYRNQPKIACIYKIVNVLEPTKIYIGSASNLKQRIEHHIRDIRKGQHHNSKLARAVLKYGLINFNVHIIEFAKGNRQELYQQEQKLIDLFEPYYNATQQACIKYYSEDNEIKEKIRAKQIGKLRNNKTTGIPNIIFCEGSYQVKLQRYGKSYQLIKTKDLEKAKEIADKYRFASKEEIEHYLEQKRIQRKNTKTTQYEGIYYRESKRHYRVVINDKEIGSSRIIYNAVRLYNNYITINKIDKPILIIKDN